MILRGREQTTDVVLDVDVAVVGTGAGGSAALVELAKKKLRAVAFDEGPFWYPSDMNQREDVMIPRLMQEGGGRMTSDLAIRVLQGRSVGGSTVHNTNLCKRAPSEILASWREQCRVDGFSQTEWDQAYEHIERALSVSPIAESLQNTNNRILARGTRALGWRGGPLLHNRVGCVGSGFCELGCSFNAKQNALKVLIPDAVSAGATVYADARIDRIVIEKGEARGVSGALLDERGRPHRSLTVRARAVVLAGSAIGSAHLALRSGLPDPSRRLGRMLRMHPGGVVAGIFQEVVDGDKGIPQSYECTEHLSFEPGSDKRVWIVPAFAHPIGTATTLSGFGATHMTAMRAYRHLAVLSAMVHDETEGEVRLGEGGRPEIRYKMSEPDRVQLERGLLACAELLFAAGAREVVIPGVPSRRLRSVSELASLQAGWARPHSVPLTAVHPMGTMGMGDDRRSSVVDPRGAYHGVAGLYVADGSLFPSSIGGPPQLTIYALGHLIGKSVASRIAS